MSITIDKYTVKADRVQENVNCILAIFAELNEKSPPDLHYASFNLEDGVSSVYIAVLDDSMESNPLPQMDAFKAFVTDIREVLRGAAGNDPGERCRRL